MSSTAAASSDCATIERRVAFDLRRGRTTSQAARDFVRRTCPCSACAEWRHAHRAVKRA